ncbi:hypothetical protein H9L39_18381 [Fusarium oxysporum f. sp. albedinis]|jgi:hypothetical protein|nr:hypothetical protein H9L39_18381 [Fusarium oxysporum f. sp. albedinis]
MVRSKRSSAFPKVTPKVTYPTDHTYIVVLILFACILYLLEALYKKVLSLAKLAFTQQFEKKQKPQVGNV